jgi:hypothetical protein
MKFRNLSLKKEFCDNIENWIKRNPQYGYRSIAQFIEDAARKRAENLGVYDREKSNMEEPDDDHWLIVDYEGKVLEITPKCSSLTNRRVGDRILTENKSIEPNPSVLLLELLRTVEAKMSKLMRAGTVVNLTAKRIEYLGHPALKVWLVPVENVTPGKNFVFRASSSIVTE